MGILLYDKSANFSAVKVGDSGLYTSLTTGLDGIFETRLSASKTAFNAAPSATSICLITGSPTYSTTSVNLTTAGAITFPVNPGNGGGNTIAFVIKIKNGGNTTDIPIASYPTNANADGALWIRNFNRTTYALATYFNSQTTPNTIGGNVTTSLAAPSNGSLDDTFQLFVVTLQSESGLTIYWPKYASSATAALTAGQFAYFNTASATNKFKALYSTSGLAQDLSMFAHWNTVLTSTQINTFYMELAQQMVRFGVTI